jgi:glycosyltransferase involved in cell wall biosynthesis
MNMSDSMRVIIAGPGGLEHGGGIGRMMGYVVDALPRVALARVDETLEVEVLDTRGPGHIIWSPFHLAAALLKLAGERLRGRPVVHVNIAGRGSTIRKLVVVPWLKLLGLPVVLHLHDYNYRAYLDAAPRPLRALVAAMFRGATMAVTLGAADRALLVELGCAPERVVVLHNAVPLPRVPARAARATVHVLFLGRLSERKGVPELIDALAAPALAGLPWRATLAGDGDLPRYQAQAQRVGVAGRIAFTGWLDRDGVARLLADADILVLPSYDEGMAMSVLEAMAYGVPVICTPVGALPELVEAEISARVVAPGDRAALAAALAALIAQPERRAQMGRAARRRIERGFAIDVYAQRLVSLYARALPPPREAPSRP